MQIGLHAQGKKKKVLSDINYQAKEEITRFNTECETTQIPLYVDAEKSAPIYEGGKHKHKSSPLPCKTTQKMIDSVLENITEQLSHVGDEVDIAVSFQITVHRPNPS